MNNIDKYSFQIRVTGILIENDKLLLVKQKVSKSRNWSLPGGRVETGETLKYAIEREFLEETGLKCICDKLLYVCDVPASSLLHITFLMIKVSGNNNDR